MNRSAQIHLAVNDHDLRLQIRNALSSNGFEISISEANGDQEIAKIPADIYIIDRTQIEKILNTTEESIIRVGDILELHTLNYEAICKGQKLPLTSSEFQMLRVLCENAPRVISREKLVEIFNQLGLDLSLRTIDNHIFNLRKKLGDCEDLIQTIRGVGYKVKLN